MANRRFIDFPIASTVGDNDIILIWQDGLNKQTTKATLLSGLPEDLADLNDVVISGLTNGQILRYNSTTGVWENTDQGNLDLTDLNDVTIVSPSNGQVLVYNSSTSQWENSSGGFVPYVGAVTTVDLGAQGLRAGYVRFDTTIASVPNEQGLMYWDDAKSTAALIMNGTIQHIGQDTFFYVKNSSGSDIPKGTCVRFAGTDGASGHLLVVPFLANGSVPSTYFMGVTAEEITNGSFGQVMHFGELDGIDTSGFAAGALLYASSTVAGAFQTTAPTAPNNIVLVAAAVNSKSNGNIYVRISYGSNINDDEGVKITTPTTGQLLQLQASGLWENKTLAQVLGGTSSQFVKGDGSLDSTSYQPLLTNPVTGTGTTNYLPKFTGASTIGNSQIFDNGTNVGIGAASPSNKLDVLGSAASPNLVGTNAYARFYQSGGYANVTIGALASGSFAGWIQTSDGVGTALPLSLQPSGGNLLVGGTSDNGARLQVSGTVTASSTTLTASANTYAGSSLKLTSFTGGTNIFLTSVSGLFALSNGGGADHLLISSTGASTFSSSVTANGTATFLGQFGNGNNVNEKVIQFLRASASTDIVNIQGINAGVGASNIALQALGGNVGIGTTTDNGARLQVSGTATFSSFITAQSSGGSGLRIYGGSGTNQWDMYLNGANIRFSDNTGTGSFVVDRPATFISTMTATGVIGITRNSGSNANALIWSTNGTSDWFLGSSPLGNSTSDLSLYSYGTGSVVFHVAKSSGNVLIGTSTSGSSRLRIVGLPTSSSGLSSGDVWNNGGTLRIV